jgi:hypothetical protein
VFTNKHVSPETELFAVLIVAAVTLLNLDASEISLFSVVKAAASVVAPNS